LELLFSLQALDEYGRLTTPLGQRMAEVPLAPSMARMLLGSQRWGCTEEVLSIAAMCSVQGLWVQAEGEKRMEHERRKFTVEEGDHLTLLNGMFLTFSVLMIVYTSFVSKGHKSSKWAHQHLLNFKALSRAVSIRSQLKRYLERYKIPMSSCKDAARPSECIRKCILSGYFPNVARMQPDGSYRLVKGDLVSCANDVLSNGRNCTSIPARSCSIAKPIGSCFMKVVPLSRSLANGSG